MSVSSLSTDFENSARKASAQIASQFMTAAYAKQKKTWSMIAAAMASGALPLMLGLANPWPLVMILPPLLLAKALKDTHTSQKKMQDAFAELLEAAPSQGRGLFHNELSQLEKTLKNFRTDIGKKDFLPKNDRTGKRTMEIGISLLMLMPPLTPFAAPSFFLMLLWKESYKTQELMKQATTVLERNKDLRP